MKHISVLGAIVFDEIITHDARRIESFGGIIYNLAALSSLVGDDGVIHPFSHVGADRYDAVMDLVGSMPHVVVDGIMRRGERLTHARLSYTDANHREEFVRYMMEPLSLDDLRGALVTDGIMVNFVNGTELDLRTLRQMREQTSAPLYLDMHNIMVRFREDDGRKEYLDFAEWPEWVSAFDLVQMNEFECRTVLKSVPKDPHGFLRAAHEVLRAGPQAVFVTMGPQGVAVAHRHEGVEYGCVIPPAPVPRFVDATGCGDAFSAGTFWNYLQTGNPVVAAMAGALVGAVNCGVQGIGQLDGARDAVNKLGEVSPELAEKVGGGWLGERLS